MGFSFRGKTSEQPIIVSETDQGISSATNAPAADLKKFRKLHQFDPFLDLDKLDRVDDVLATGDPEKEAAVEEQLIIDDSPYPEVRSSVSAYRKEMQFSRIRQIANQLNPGPSH